MNNRMVGASKEELAVQYLIDKGYEIIERNFRCKSGEIDIIASYNGAMIFVEVKYRRTAACGYSVAAVSPAKQQTIRKVATYYLVTKYHRTDIACRFDVVGIDGDEFTHIIDAF